MAIALTEHGTSTIEETAYRKVTLRIMPFLMICYVVAYLDRVNVGFAKLQMLSDLKFSEAVYGLGAGMFFIGYFFFEVPSNLIMQKVGAKLWIARIMITWGIISGLFAFVSTRVLVLCIAFSFGGSRSRFLSRDYIVSDLLVSILSARPQDRIVHDRHSRVGHLRRSAFRMGDGKLFRRSWMERLAVDVSDRGRACRAARGYYAYLS